MKAGISTQATRKPSPLNMRKLFGNYYELTAADDIKELTVADDVHGDGKERAKRTEYTYKLYQSAQTVESYDDAVSALVRLKYTSGDEIALMRKGITDASNAEYTAYLDYVEQCKAAARSALGITAKSQEGDSNDGGHD